MWYNYRDMNAERGFIMQLVLPFEHMAKAAQYMEPSVFEYVREGEIESFESFEKFNFLAFDWYDVHSKRTEDYKMLAYVSRENLIIFTEGAAGDTAKKIMDGLAAENPELRSEQLLYRFFVRLLNGDMDCLSRLENEIDEYENVYLFKSESGKDVFEKLSAWRRELLRIKRYYEQLTLIFDEASANDNSVFSNSAAKRFAILKNRTDRYLQTVQNLRDVIEHLQEEYQAQLSIQQNDLMKLFTVVTVIFLPLTLLTGWYGMNFSGMPELNWEYGYLVIIVVSIVVLVALVLFFRRKKWL